MSVLPTVSVVMISYNDEHIIGDCLSSIFSQEYPEEKLKVLVVDGGSMDATQTIVRRTKATLIVRPDLKDQPIKRGEIAVDTPSTDTIVFFSADNRFLEKDCLKRMMEPFADDEIVAVETLRYGYRKKDPIITRYFALIGGADPVAVGLGKADRGPYDRNGWHSFGEVKDMGSYYSVAFSDEISEIPTLGANGFAIRRSALKTMNGCRNSLHIELCVALIRSGNKRFAFVKDAHVIHFINISPLSFINRRVFFAEMYSDENVSRTYRVFDPRKDLFRLVWILLTYPTFVVPFLRAVKGYAAYPDSAWFLHPLMSFSFTFGYGIYYLRKLCKKTFRLESHRPQD